MTQFNRKFRLQIALPAAMVLSLIAAPVQSDSCAGVKISVDSSLNVRSGPGSGHARIGSVRNNQRYHRLGTANNGWVRIRFDSRTGYVHPNYVVKGNYGNCKRVTASSLNIRSGPGTSYAVVGGAPNGSKWFANGTSGSWTSIFYGGAKRYGFTKYLINAGGTGNPPVTGDVNVKDYAAYVTASTLNLRSGPGTNYPIVGKLSNKTRVVVTHHNGSWRKVKAGTKRGYVHSAYLVRESSLQPPPKISNFRINDGAVATSNRKVTLRFSRTGTRPTQYRASQRSDFVGATWKPYTYPVPFTLSASHGGKRVYFQTRDGYRRTSNTVSDGIRLDACALQRPSTLIYNETILPARDNVIVRSQPRIDACTDTGIRVDIDTDERMRVRGARNGWFYIDAIVDLNGNVLRSASGWVRNSDVGTNEAVRVYWDQGGVNAWNMDVTIRVDDTTRNVFYNQQFGWNHGGAGYFGFQQFPSGRKFIFSLFSSSAGGPGSVVEFDSDYDCQIASNEPGIAGPLRCLDDFAWSVGQAYTLRLWRLRDQTGGTRWGAWVLDANGNNLFKIGEFLVRHSSNAPHFVNSVISFLEDFENDRDCSVPGSTRFHVARPSFNGGRSRATYSGNSIGPCSNGSSAASTRFSGGRELRFNVN